MTWIDGSVSDDLPRRRLGRIYSVNHFHRQSNEPGHLMGRARHKRRKQFGAHHIGLVGSNIQSEFARKPPLCPLFDETDPGDEFAYPHDVFRCFAGIHSGREYYSVEAPIRSSQDFGTDFTGRNTCAYRRWRAVRPGRKSSLFATARGFQRCLDTILDEYEHEAERQHSIPRRQKRRRAPATRKKAA